MAAPTQTLRIAAIADEARDIRTYRLVGTDGSPLPAAPPGSHLDLYLPDGLVRQYSLCQDPGDRNAYLIAVKRETASRGGSAWLHDRAAEGMTLEAGLPRSILAPAPAARHHILLAGGIGITPLYSLARSFEATAASYELHYFVRSAEHAAFLGALRASPSSHRLHLHAGLANDALTPTLARILASQPAHSHVYVCGPVPFMDAVQIEAGRHWAPEHIHEERFAAPPPQAHAAAPSGVGTVEVVLASTGVTIPVAPGTSLLAALNRAGQAIPASCEQGFCGTCMTGVVEGCIEHHDTFLTPEEQQSGRWIMPCVSHATGTRLVLDL
ncbi:PDR/VanB family oxidoreductase [Comamonadaceae bacterium PP-2]